MGRFSSVPFSVRCFLCAIAPFAAQGFLSVIAPITAQAADETPERVQAPDSQNQLIKYSDSGVEPAMLKMKKEDSIVFFLNDTSDSLLTLRIDFGPHTTHCSSPNLAVQGNGVVASAEPIEPRNFATTCFHDTGSYDVEAFGLQGSSKPVKATVVVE